MDDIVSRHFLHGYLIVRRMYGRRSKYRMMTEGPSGRYVYSVVSFSSRHKLCQPCVCRSAGEARALVYGREKLLYIQRQGGEAENIVTHIPLTVNRG